MYFFTLIPILFLFRLFFYCYVMHPVSLAPVFHIESSLQGEKESFGLTGFTLIPILLGTIEDSP
jgi:hypothetical protein